MTKTIKMLIGSARLIIEKRAKLINFTALSSGNIELKNLLRSGKSIIIIV
jgi:hypothetical protein